MSSLCDTVTDHSLLVQLQERGLSDLLETSLASSRAAGSCSGEAPPHSLQ